MLNGVKALASYPGGYLADRLGTQRVVLAGWILYACSYAGLALARTIFSVLAVMAFYGLYYGLSEGGERALLADLSPDFSRGRAFGWYHALTGGASLVGGLWFGAVWSKASSAWAFASAGGIAGLSAVLLAALLPIAKGAASRRQASN
jgi:MFS family permease